jgi:hypothetical protein
MTRWVEGALLGALFGAVVYQAGGRQSYARRAIRVAKRRGKPVLFLYPAVQWAIVGAGVGLLVNVAEDRPALSGLP